MSDETGRSSEPASAAKPPDSTPTVEWAVASTAAPTTPISPATGPGATTGGEPGGETGAEPGLAAAHRPNGPNGPDLSDDGSPRLQSGPVTGWQSSALPPGAGSSLPPAPGPYQGWQPPPDVAENGPGRPSRKLPIGLAAAGGAVLIAGAAFAAGMAIANNSDTLQTTSSQGPAAGQGGLPGQGNQGGQFGPGQDDSQSGQGQAAPGTGLPDGIGRLVAAGTITKIEGDTLTVQGQQGLVTVTTTADTLVEADLGGQVSALQVDSLIFVAGETRSDGTVLAKAIADRPFFRGIPDRGGSGQNGSTPDDQNQDDSSGTDT